MTIQGMNIGDIARAVGYMIPSSLSVWTQQLGCAGQSGDPALAILLVKPFIFIEKKKKTAEKKTAV